MSKPDLSIIILSYNTKDLLKNCLDSLDKAKKEINFETIVVDNASTDGSAKLVKKNYPNIKLIQNRKNLGFSAGNNAAKKIVKSEFVLFLNSDTEVQKNTLKQTVKYIKNHPSIGVITTKMILPSGKLDLDARRSFPTPWVALTHFSGLDKVFPKSKLFAKYWYGYLPESKTHDIDVAQGAFFLTRKKILDEVGWFDKNYFLDGEDIDLSWKIKHLGLRIVYYPKVSILHIKKASKKNKKKIKLTHSGVDSMEIFYRKNMWKQYPRIINLLVVAGIRTMKIIRTLKHFTI